MDEAADHTHELPYDVAMLIEEYKRTVAIQAHEIVELRRDLRLVATDRAAIAAELSKLRGKEAPSSNGKPQKKAAKAAKSG